MIFVLQYIRKLLHNLRKHYLGRLAVFLLVVGVLGTWGILFFEKGHNSEFETLKDALWWMIVTMTTVGYGDKYPLTPGGQILGSILMVTGIGLLGMLTATIASIFVEGSLKDGMGLGRIKMKKHIVICGWNTKAREIIHEFQSKIGKRVGRIGIIADLDTKPIDDWTVAFVRGDYSNEEVLKRANIEKAETVIILADQKLMRREEDADAKSILTALAIKAINPGIYVCMELLDPSNRRHGEIARADEIIVSSEMSSRLLSRSALDHGISKFYSEIITSRYGNEIYKLEIPEMLRGMVFEEAMLEVRRRYKAILLGVERQGELLTNPEIGFKLAAGDQLLLLAQELVIPASL